MHSLYLFRDLKPQRNRHASSVCLEIAQEGQMRRHMLEKRDQLAHNNSFFFFAYVRDHEKKKREQLYLYSVT